MAASRITKLPTGLLQLRIDLKHTKPKVWRRLLVPQGITLLKLHLVIQAAFQWGGYHLHEFDAAGERFGTPDPDYDDPGSLRSERTRLTTAVTPTGWIDYLYDFGDSWDHRVKIERVLPALGIDVPTCLDGGGATPPEDCGGIGGYTEFVAAMRDPAHPEHQTLREWSRCDTWDPEQFDIEAVNQRLADLRR